MFDESLPFGQNEKQEFLERVGLIRAGESWSQSAEAICALGGVVRHLQTGHEEVESDFRKRMLARQQSLDSVLERADELAEQQLGIRAQWLTLLSFKTRKLRHRFRKFLNTYGRNAR
jgi:hypothetical protein